MSNLTFGAKECSMHKMFKEGIQGHLIGTDTLCKRCVFFFKLKVLLFQDLNYVSQHMHESD